MVQIYLSPQDREYLDYTMTLPKGHGTPETLVVYLHGFASNQGGEKALFFRDRFTEIGAAFVAFDHRGHGASSGTMKELTIRRNLEDLGAILKAAAGEFKKRVLIGSSMGGQTAAWFAMRHPDQVTANLLIAPAFSFLQKWLKEMSPKDLRTLKKSGELTIRNEWVEVTVGKSLVDDVRRFPVNRLAPRYQTPSLILHGTLDDAVPFQGSVEFIRKARARPLELVLIGGGDHRLTDFKEVLFSQMSAFCHRLGIL